MKKPTILIIDNSLQNIELLRLLLNGEYNVVYATNGLDGYDQAIKHRPDLILLEVMMPIMDGYTICTKLKENIDTMEIPIIFISSLSSRDEILTGLNAGAIDFIHKPLDEEYLKIKIRNHLLQCKM